VELDDDVELEEQLLLELVEELLELGSPSINITGGFFVTPRLGFLVGFPFLVVMAFPRFQALRWRKLKSEPRLPKDRK
jgi:hypothetical protein